MMVNGVADTVPPSVKSRETEVPYDVMETS